MRNGFSQIRPKVCLIKPSDSIRKTTRAKLFPLSAYQTISAQGKASSAYRTGVSDPRINHDRGNVGLAEKVSACGNSADRAWDYSLLQWDAQSNKSVFNRDNRALLRR